MTASSRPRLYLVRHGQTDWNAAGRLLSFTDMDINATGRAQAQRLAADLAGVHWARAFSSPRLRARHTAELVLTPRQDAPLIHTDERLVELDFGPYEGWSEAELEADPLARTRRGDGAELEGMESVASVAARTRSFLDDLADQGGNSLVVAHGRMLRIMIAGVLGLPPSGSQAMRMRNCRPAVIEPGRRPLLLGFNLGPPGDEAA